jgi:dihydrofolate reductase
MLISAIVATATNNVIGKNNEIPWYLPADLRYFKEKTLGHHILMGRNSYESIGRPLPKRTNVIITRNPYYIVSGCVVVHSIEEGLTLAAENGETEVFIIGGGEIYRQAMDYCDRIYLTTVNTEVEGTVFFPILDETIWKLVEENPQKADEKNEFDYCFKVFERRLSVE